MTNQANGQATDSSPSLLQRLQRTRDRHLGDSLLGAVLLALRPDLALALTLPALVGSVIGGWWVGAFDWVRFIFGVGGVLIAAIALQVLMAYQDFEQSLRVDARPATDAPESTFTLQQHGVLPPSLLLNLGALLYTASVLCGLWLALLAGWPILFFGGLAVLLQLAAVIPPVRFAYRGYGLGEAGVFVAFGVLSAAQLFLCADAAVELAAGAGRAADRAAGAAGRDEPKSRHPAPRLADRQTHAGRHLLARRAPSTCTRS
jgi:MFS family permease